MKKDLTRIKNGDFVIDKPDNSDSLEESEKQEFIEESKKNNQEKQKIINEKEQKRIELKEKQDKKYKQYLDLIKKYKANAKEDKLQISKKIEAINLNLKKVEGEINQLEEERENLTDDAFIAKRRILFKEKRVLEENKIKKKRKIEELEEDIKTLAYYQNKITNSLL
jgi:hypothetical protein